MGKFRRIILIFSFVAVIFIAGTYFLYLFCLPKVVMSEKFVSKFEDVIFERLKYRAEIEGVYLKTYPNLSAEFRVKNFSLENFLRAENVSAYFNPLKVSSGLVSADYILFDKSKFGPRVKGKKSNINLKNCPSVKILRGNVIMNSYINVNFKNLNILSNGSKKIISLNAWLKIKPLDDVIRVGDEGFLSYDGHELSAKDFAIKLGDEKLDLNGIVYGHDGSYNAALSGQGVDVEVLRKNFLSFMKFKDKKKNFIENFYNFTGNANIDLKLSASNITGSVCIKNLGAKTVKFDIPINFPNAEFKFAKDKVIAKTVGTFGGEKVYTDLYVVDMFSKSRVVSGNVKSVLNTRFSKKYTPEYKISGIIPVSVNYQIKNRIPTVRYNASIGKNSNIYFKNADLGLTDRDRRVFAMTQKIGNKLVLRNYDYSFTSGGRVQNILLGDGLFIQRNGKLVLDYINCKTNGDAPVSITGSFGRYVDGGTFNGDIHYSYPKNLLTGKFRLKNSRYKEFYLKKAVVKADSESVGIAADGTYRNEPFMGYVDLLNSFEDKITINDLHLYLSKYVVKRGSARKKDISNSEFVEKTKDIEWEIKNGSILVDEIRHNNIVLNNIEIVGSLLNNKVTFLMPGTIFADGMLYAKGSYDINENSSDIYFAAMDIDSNKAATMLFNLKDQVEGSANATMALKTYNGIEDFDAHTEFFIEDGALTKIGSTEFMIKKNKKIKRDLRFKLSDIINVDIDKMKALKSNLYGSFDINDSWLNDVQIFSKHRYLSLYTEGNYDIRNENANIRVWGKYNRTAQKHIKIFFIPLSWITKAILRPEYSKNMYQDKLNKIPPIEAKKYEEVNFVVRMFGNLNDNSSIKVDLKSIK